MGAEGRMIEVVQAHHIMHALYSGSKWHLFHACQKYIFTVKNNTAGVSITVCNSINNYLLSYKQGVEVAGAKP